MALGITHKDSRAGDPQSSFLYVRRQIEALIARYNLLEWRSQILQTYADICKDSLAFPRGARPARFSRINSDGAPIQFSVTIGPSRPALQFLGEAGGPGLSGAERMQVSRCLFPTIAQQLHMNTALSSITRLVDEMAPEKDFDLLADPGGAYWIGAAFATGREPHLRIYINARWGKERDRWARLSWFAAHFGQTDTWRDIAAALAPHLQPLGAAITLQGDQPPSGRIYLSAYGKLMSYYEDLAGVYGGDPFTRQLRAFGRSILGDDYAYPTPTGVCSFGFGEGCAPDFKVELCAHCCFPSDAEAAARLRSWFETAQLNARGYWDALDILSGGNLSDRATGLHCYVGLGRRRGAPYSSIYLKPRLVDR